ncbi:MULTISPECIES: GNAT family N-acetyltransferase [unclassified Paenibacillus]|uniref:GNAT family N-acetyltransferase n=1 Tax=unclassified Paenibacillus TaxID=185978 RepID=UPI002F402131
MPDMLVKLYDLPELGPVMEDMKNKGIVIRRGLGPEKNAVAKWAQEHFSEYWKSECEVAFSRQPVTCFIAAAEIPGSNKSKMLGFACYDSTLRGFFGPTGVSEETRGQGVGKALLLASLHAMKEEGYGYAVIGAAGPVDFYAKQVGAIEIPDSVPGVYRGLLANS